MTWDFKASRLKRVLLMALVTGPHHSTVDLFYCTRSTKCLWTSLNTDPPNWTVKCSSAVCLCVCMRRTYVRERACLSLCACVCVCVCVCGMVVCVMCVSERERERASERE